VNILLVAEESAGIQVLRMLASTEHTVTAVLTAPPTRGGGATVARVAEQLGVPVLPSVRVGDPKLAEWVSAEQVDLILNVHSLHVMDSELVAAPRIGSFNLHPGPLPQYAGLNAPSWAIYNGERRHAVTVHRMEAGIDTGAVAFESWFDLREDDTAFTVAARCVKLGVPLIARLVEAAERDAIPVWPQDLSRRRYFGGEPPEGGRMIWSRPAQEIVNLVRACDYSPFPSPWGHPSARLDSRSISVTKAARTRQVAGALPGTVGAVDGDEVNVAAGDEWIAVRRVQLAGEPLSAAAVLQPGMRLKDGE
jgi:UDP-4-amino-4-deoxy-L-arabinose formyltransferase/UDP-glucuronic acid dehydrogenase (UDP-4-keto-hexauronic acid decarboxylating)